MTARPEQVERLEAIQGGAKIAHEVMFDVHRELLEREPARTDSAKLLAESAQIAAMHLPGLTVRLRRLAARWDEENLLDPAAAEETAQQIATEFAAIQPRLKTLIARQREIGARLRALLGS
jgi:hypothetical protein